MTTSKNTQNIDNQPNFNIQKSNDKPGQFISLEESIKINSLQVDSNNNKIADYLEDSTGKLDLLVLFESFNKLPNTIDIAGIKLKKKFSSLPVISIEADASLLPIISKLEGVSVIEENLPMEKKLAYSTSQLGVRPYLWDLGLSGSSDYSVAVIDSGIDTTHSAFSNRIVATFNAIDNNATLAIDTDGHGTHVAGIIAGLPITGNNSFNQSTRGNLPDQDGSFFPDMLLANINQTVSIKVGMDWGPSEGPDNPTGTAFVAILKSIGGSWRFGCTECKKTNTTGIVETTFTNIPPGDYYVAFGNEAGAGDQFYEGWAEIIYDSETPNQIHEDEYPIFSGVAHSTNIVAIKVLDDDGNGDSSTFLDAVDWIILNKEKYNITVVNLSLGVSDKVVASVDVAVTNMVNNGIVVVAAAGNDGPNSGGIFSPASAPEAITVGAVNRFNEIAYYSSIGDPKINSKAIKPDVVAPGGSAALPAIGWDSSYPQGLGYIVAPDSNYVGYNVVADDLTGLQGTSMAAPHISGLAAILVQYIAKTDGWTWNKSDVFRIKQAILAGTYEVANIGSNGGESKQPTYPDPKPTIDRNQKDYVEGWGAVDGKAAFDALSNIFPLNQNQNISMSFEDPFVPNVKTWKFEVEANMEYSYRVDVPEGVDVDLLVIDPSGGRNGELSILYSTDGGKGVDEEIIINEYNNKDLIFSVRLVDSDNVQDFISVLLLNPDFEPNIEMITPINGSYLSSNTVAVIFNSPSNTVETYLDEVFIGIFNSGDKLFVLSQGSHNLTLIENNMNNGKTFRVSIIFTVDTENPILTSDVVNLNGKSFKNPQAINFTASDNFELDRVAILVDGVVANVTGFPGNQIILNPRSFLPGTHNLKLVVYDKAGNSDEESVIATFLHSLYIIKMTDITYEYDETIPITWQASSTLPDNYSIYVKNQEIFESSWDGNEIVYDFSFSKVGSFTIKLIVYDTNGEFTSEEFLLTLVDNTKPQIIGPESDIYDVTNPLQINFDIIELLPHKIEIYLNGSLRVKAVPWNGSKVFTKITVNGEIDTISNVTVIVSDTSGNTDQLTIFLIWKDLTAPVLSSPDNLSFEQGSTDLGITWSWVEKYLVELEVLSNDNQIVFEDNPALSSVTVPSSYLNSLKVGENTFLIKLKDIGGNEASDSVQIIVTGDDGLTPKAFLNNLSFQIALISLLIINKYRKNRKIN